MKIIVAPDSYKGCLTAFEVADAMEAGIRDAQSDAIIWKIPLADGGEGTVEAVLRAVGGQKVELTVTGPLGLPQRSFYGILPDRTTAVIEMAAAAGLPLVPARQLNPLVATTYGVGELIRDAIKRGCRKLIIGLGGSATNDGGAGMAAALGARLLDAAGKPLPFGGGALGELRRIETDAMLPEIRECEFIAASDVTNPLCGEYGASAVFAPQKGATKEMAALLDRNLAHYAAVIKRDLAKDIAEVSGAGAAGGLGAGLLAFLSAKIASGLDILLGLTRFAEKVAMADIVFTGEGKTDRQTVFGKAPVGIAAAAKKFGKPVVCLSGSVGADVKLLHERGVDVVISVTPAPIPLEQAIAAAKQNIRQTAAQIMRAILLGKSL
ncbi:MAG TPA: glycerate kinase [Bacilli bacterium]